MPSWNEKFSTMSMFLLKSVSNKSFQLSIEFVTSGGLGGGLAYGSWYGEDDLCWILGPIGWVYQLLLE